MKPKTFLQQALTLVGAFLMSSALATQALAAGTEQGTTGIDSIFGVSRGYILPNTSCAWLVDLYVSNRPDGKIDTTVSSMHDTATKVGGIFYADDLPENCIISNTDNTYARSINTSKKFDGYSTYYCGFPETNYRYTNEYLSPSDTALWVYEGFGWNVRAYINYENTTGLPTDMLSINEYTYDALVKNVLESEDFTKLCIDNLRTFMGDSLLKSQLQAVVDSKILSGINSFDDYQRLFPDSEDPIVEWAAVVTPYMICKAKSGYEGFWIISDTGAGLNVVAPDEECPSICYLMDAPTAARYNTLTKEIDYAEALRASDHEINVNGPTNGEGSTLTEEEAESLAELFGF